MKRVNIQIMKDGSYADYVVWMEDNHINIETSDEQGSLDLWKFAKFMADTGKISGCGTRDGEHEDLQVFLTVNDGFKGKIEAVEILTRFKAGEEISLTGIL